MKIIVTGSSGSIGTRVCQELIEQGHDVVGVDWKPNNWDPNVDAITVNVDLRDTEQALQKIPTDAEMVIHLAANARVYNLIDDPLLARDNFNSLFSMLEFVRVNDIKKFIFASSREVYGEGETLSSEEDADIIYSESPYSASKIGGEAIIHAYNKTYGVPFVILRFANVYGMYDDSDRVIPLFIKRCLQNQDITVYGEGKVLDFTHSDDIMSGIQQTITKFDEVTNQTFNLSCGEGTSILKLAQLIKDELHTNNNIIIEPNRPGEVMVNVVNVTKAKNMLACEPQVPIEAGIKKTIEWYKTNLYSELV